VWPLFKLVYFPRGISNVEMEKHLIFPVSEYRARLENVRGEMRKSGVEVLLVLGPENIFYLTGHQTFGFQNYQCCIVSLESDPVLVLRFLESFNGHAFAWVKDVEVWEDHEDPAAVTARVLLEKGWGNLRVGSDDTSLFFPPAVRHRLDVALNGKLQAASGVVERCRAVKSAAELAYMRKAAVYTDIGLEAALDEVYPGLSENDVAARAFDALTRAGSEYVQIQPIVTSGWRSGIPHTTYQRRLMEPGDAVLIELTGTHHRYVSPIMRTAVIGKPDAKVADMYRVCEEALSATLKTIKAGVTAGSVDDVARKIITDAGYYPNWRKRAGYSVGCSFPPDWGEGHIVSLRHQDSTLLLPGMVFHVPIAFRDYGVAGVGISETVVVTETGCEQLGSSPRELVIV